MFLRLCPITIEECVGYGYTKTYINYEVGELQ